MPRRHRGGFVSQEMYMDIGTEEQRGRDGDTSRLAAQKYNDHRHPAFEAVTLADLDSWASEGTLESSIDGRPGGIIENDVQQNIRQPGDLAIQGGRLFMSLGSSGEFVRVGGGLGSGGISLVNNNQVFVPDSMSFPLEMQPMHIPNQGPVDFRRADIEVGVPNFIAEQVCFAEDYNVNSAQSARIMGEIVASIFISSANMTNEEQIFFLEGEGPRAKVTFHATPMVNNSFEEFTNPDPASDTLSIESQTGDPFYFGQARYEADKVEIHTLENLLIRCSVEMAHISETLSPQRIQQIQTDSFGGIEADMVAAFNGLSGRYKLDILSLRLKVNLEF